MNLDEGFPFPCEKCGILCCFDCGGDNQCDDCLEQEEADFDAAAEAEAQAAQQSAGAAPEAASEEASSGESGSGGSS
jgi:hypothetical protein